MCLSDLYGEWLHNVALFVLHFKCAWAIVEISRVNIRNFMCKIKKSPGKPGTSAENQIILGEDICEISWIGHYSKLEMTSINDICYNFEMVQICYIKCGEYLIRIYWNKSLNQIVYYYTI